MVAFVNFGLVGSDAMIKICEHWTVREGRAMSIWVAYSAFIVDRGLDGMDALKASIQLTAPHRTNVLVYTLLSMLVVAGGLLACCVGALLLSFPILMIGNAYLYLKLIGEQPRLPGA